LISWGDKFKLIFIELLVTSFKPKWKPCIKANMFY